MPDKEKGTIVEIEHSVSREVKLFRKKNPQVIIHIKATVYADSLYYLDEEHAKMIEEINTVIRKYI